MSETSSNSLQGAYDLLGVTIYSKPDEVEAAWKKRSGDPDVDKIKVSAAYSRVNSLQEMIHNPHVTRSFNDISYDLRTVDLYALFELPATCTPDDIKQVYHDRILSNRHTISADDLAYFTIANVRLLAEHEQKFQEPLKLRAGTLHPPVRWGGDVIVDPDAMVSGRIFSENGNIEIGKNAWIQGDVTALYGTIRKEASASTGKTVDLNSSSEERIAAERRETNFDQPNVRNYQAVISNGPGAVIVQQGVTNIINGPVIGESFSTDGNQQGIDLRRDAPPGIESASYVEIHKGQNVLRADSLDGRRSMSIRDGVIQGGTVTVNGVHVGRGTVDLNQRPDTRGFVR